VAFGKVPSIIVTFGTLAIYRAFLVDYSGAKTIVTDLMPKWVIDLPQSTLFSIGGLDIRPMVLLALAVVVAFELVIRYLPFGRRLHAIGSNPEAARISGLPASPSPRTFCAARWRVWAASCFWCASATSRWWPRRAWRCRSCSGRWARQH
jgi:ribose/xylose/arabinose/galactoside ABC-type transport system permease subunit